MHRPQQLLVRFAENTNVYFFEEPIFDAGDAPFLTYATRSETLWKVVPHLPACTTAEEVTSCLAQLLDQLLENANLDKWAFWYFAKTALPFTEKYKPSLVIYDQIEEPEPHIDWNDIFRSVSQQIKKRLPISNVIALHP